VSSRYSCDRAIVPQVVRQVQGCHATRVELALEKVAIGESGSQPCDGFGHDYCSRTLAMRARNSASQPYTTTSFGTRTLLVIRKRRPSGDTS